MQFDFQFHKEYVISLQAAHLLSKIGLRYQIKAGEPKPAIFADPAYDSTRHWNLSTSQISSEFYNGYGWGEVVPNGYGIPYWYVSVALRLIRERGSHDTHLAFVTSLYISR